MEWMEGELELLYMFQGEYWGRGAVEGLCGPLDSGGLKVGRYTDDVELGNAKG